MVRHHAVGHVLVADIISPDAVGVGLGVARGRLDGGEDGRKQVSGVVAHLTLEHRGDALQPRARVNVLRGQADQAAVGLAVELDEHQVPHLQHIGVVFESRGGGGGDCEKCWSYSWN